MAVLKEAHTGMEFQNEAKEYVINMINGSRKLHIKNNCPNSKCLYKYYDFESLDDVEKCGIEFTKCKKCFKETK